MKKINSLLLVLAAFLIMFTSCDASVAGMDADTEAPVITLNGDSNMTLNTGDYYSEQGADAYDLVDGDISSKIVVGGDIILTSSAGTYNVTYNVSDSEGNSADEVIRTVIVEADQPTPPGSTPSTLPETGVVYSSAETTSLHYSDLSPWDSGSNITTVDDSEYGTSLNIAGGSAWAPTQCLAFVGLGKTGQEGLYYESYATVSFKIKVTGVSTFILYAKGIETVLDISTGTALGNDWYEFSVDLAGIDGAIVDDGQLAFLVDAAFTITGVVFSGTPNILAGLPLGGGYLYTSNGTQTIFFSDVTPWESESTISSVVDAEYGSVLNAAGGTFWGSTQCLAFAGVGRTGQSGIYYENYTVLTFKIKTSGVTDFVLYAEGFESTHNISQGTDAGNGWLEFSVGLVERTGTLSNDGQIAFLVDAAFSIADVEFSGVFDIPELPVAGGFVYSSSGSTPDIIFTDLSPWDSGSNIATVQDSNQGTVLSVSGGTVWGPTQCISFLDIGQVAQWGFYFNLYTTLRFKINTTATIAKLHAGGIDLEGYSLSGTDLGNGWTEVTVPLSAFPGSSLNNGQLAFLIDAAFKITDVELY